MEILAADAWRARSAAHEARVDAWVVPYLERRRRGEDHPVEDFLFTYYSHRPSALRRWHPGYGVGLADAPDHAALPGYVGGEVTTASAGLLGARRPLLRSVRDLLAATASRPANLSCFGLHEWAMVYRLPAGDLRHPWPLRLGGDGTDEVVQSHRIGCSHFDAYRFFTEAARPRNALRPAAENRADLEQPGCLHAGMDLYKHAFRLSPLVPSELVADCFALARDIRVLDMRASPYDLTDLGYEPVCIETPAGKREFAAGQRQFAERGAPLRTRLLDVVEGLLASAEPPAFPSRPDRVPAPQTRT